MSSPQSWIVVDQPSSSSVALERGVVGSDTVRDLLLSHDDRDLVVENGDLVLAAGLESVGQDAEMRLKMFRGEWEWNLEDGTPFFEEILVKRPNLVAVRARFRERIEDTVGVAALTLLNLDYESSTRHLVVKWQAVSDLGELIAGESEVPK